MAHAPHSDHSDFSSDASSEALGWFDDTTWLDKWWPAFLILFGLSFVLFLACFPQNSR